MKRYEISNCEWERIKDKLPAERTGKRGRPAKNNRYNTSKIKYKRPFGM